MGVYFWAITLKTIWIEVKRDYTVKILGFWYVMHFTFSAKKKKDEMISAGFTIPEAK